MQDGCNSLSRSKPGLRYPSTPSPPPQPSVKGPNGQLWWERATFLETRAVRPPMAHSWDVDADPWHLSNPVFVESCLLCFFSVHRHPNLQALGEGWSLASKVAVTWNQTYSLVVGTLSSGLQQNRVSYKRPTPVQGFTICTLAWIVDSGFNSPRSPALGFWKLCD